MESATTLNLLLLLNESLPHQRIRIQAQIQTIHNSFRIYKHNPTPLSQGDSTLAEEIWQANIDLSLCIDMCREAADEHLSFEECKRDSRWQLLRRQFEMWFEEHEWKAVGLQDMYWGLVARLNEAMIMSGTRDELSSMSVN